ncbi:MAG: hypothetical protein M1832_000438 [Thelocarpon impressellum]|nr:MAG: hypothetical protein M1832_000438 [Thelocarpon impressellum]
MMCRGERPAEGYPTGYVRESFNTLHDLCVASGCYCYEDITGPVVCAPWYGIDEALWAAFDPYCHDTCNCVQLDPPEPEREEDSRRRVCESSTSGSCDAVRPQSLGGSSGGTGGQGAGVDEPRTPQRSPPAGSNSNPAVPDDGDSDGEVVDSPPATPTPSRPARRRWCQPTCMQHTSCGASEHLPGGCQCVAEEPVNRLWKATCRRKRPGRRDLGLDQEPLACPCNASYVSKACCAAPSGWVHEPTELWLGTLAPAEEAVVL